jgi:group I intron endonuclease
MYYTIYQLTNLINNKIYIGMHQTMHLDDRYMGSGSYLRRAQNKYGLENFLKEILFTYDNIDDMINKERQLVNTRFVARSDTYNLIEGGPDNMLYINRRGLNLYGMNGKTPNVVDNFKQGLATQQHLRLTDPIWCARRANKLAMAAVEFYAAGGKNPFKGKKHTAHSKNAIGEKSKIHQAGDGNSQFGTFVITDGKTYSRCKHEHEIPQGWYRSKQIAKSKRPPAIKKTTVPKPPNLVSAIKLCAECKHSLNEATAIEWFETFKAANNTSIREFVKLSDYPYSHVSFTKMLIKYIPAYNAIQGKPFIQR